MLCITQLSPGSYYLVRLRSTLSTVLGAHSEFPTVAGGGGGGGVVWRVYYIYVFF